MRYPASEKLEIILLVEHSHLPVRRTLDKLDIPSTTFYRWYDRYRAFGKDGLSESGLKTGHAALPRICGCAEILRQSGQFPIRDKPYAHWTGD